MTKSSPSLADSLIAEGLLKPEQLKQVEAEVKRTREPFQKVLKRYHFVDDRRLVDFYSRKFNIPRIEIGHRIIKPEVLALIPLDTIRKLTVLPIMKLGTRLTVAMSDPLNLNLIDQLRLKTGFDVEPALATEAEIKSAIDQYYGARSDMSHVLEDMEEEKKLQPAAATGLDISTSEDAPIIKFVNSLMQQALRDGASDIHVCPERDKILVRLRVDGILHEVDRYPKSSHAGVVSRVKVMAGLDITESRTAQEGRVRFESDGQIVDLRISIMPTIHGENIVIRLLNTVSALMPLEGLGLNDENLNRIKDLVTRPFGLILITGPTGSGKTTTLYAALNQINDPKKNIVTIEDPVEYQLPFVRQIQVNSKVELTFATGLRSILRQDPDVIMIGEIRDKETAEIAIQAALTGHLVLSTLHTNDSVSAMTRLRDMKVESYLMASTVTAVLAQRLVRTVCADCVETYFADGVQMAHLRSLGLELGKEKSVRLLRGKGCFQCKKTGYRGRLGLFELLVPSPEFRQMVAAGSPLEELHKDAAKNGLITLREDGARKISQGMTTLEEILRVTQDIQ